MMQTVILNKMTRMPVGTEPWRMLVRGLIALGASDSGNGNEVQSRSTAHTLKQIHQRIDKDSASRPASDQALQCFQELSKVIGGKGKPGWDQEGFLCVCVSHKFPKKMSEKKRPESP